MSKAEAEAFLESRKLLVKALANLRETPHPKRRPEFRVSSLPFCGLLYLLNHETYREQSDEFSSHYYFKTGTAIHELMQLFFPLGDYKDHVFGDWRCRKCQHVLRRCTTPKIRCAKCRRKRWEYQEIDLRYRGVSGHVDMLFQIPWQGETYYIVADFKTTKLDNKAPQTLAKYPVPQNVVQIQTYCTLLRELYGLKIIGWHLIYMDRREPLRSASNYHITSGAWGDERHTAWLKRVQGWCAANRLTEKVRGAENESAAVKALADVTARRPCRSLADFNAKMSPLFYYEEGGACPHMTKCLHCTDKQVTQYFAEQLNLLE